MPCLSVSSNLETEVLAASDGARPSVPQGAVAHIPKKWTGVQGLFLKTSDSVALPIYQTLPDAQQKISAS